MAPIEPFTGFPHEGLHFLEQLAFNNNREWFNENKATFLESLQAPAVAFVVALGERLKALSPGLTYDTRTNGAGSLMRIYRDTRFSKDKTPYKTHQSMTFWEGPSKKHAPSGFFLRVEPEGAMMYTGVHRFEKEALAAYRDAVADDELGATLEEAIKAVRAAGDYPIGGEHYKRVPRGFDPAHPRADLLRHNSLYTHSPRVGARHLASPELVDLCFEHFANMEPLHRWLVEMRRANT